MSLKARKEPQSNYQHFIHDAEWSSAECGFAKSMRIHVLSFRETDIFRVFAVEASTVDLASSAYH